MRDWREKRRRDWRQPAPFNGGRPLERSQEHDIRTRAGRGNMGADILGLANDFAAMAQTYDDTRRGVERLQILRDLEAQLAPGQEVRVLMDPQTNKVLSIDRPGAGYLRATDDKLEVFQLKGDDEGMCRTNPVRDTTQFNVPDEDRRMKKLDLFEDRGPHKRDRDDDDADAHDKKDRSSRLP